MRDRNFHYMLQMAFWKNTGAWSPKNLTETDHASLWSRKGSCVLAFRGSDSMIDFKSNMNQAPINYYGLSGVFQGMAKEFQAVISVMQMGNALSLIRTTCSTSITVTGHSLGGAISQLFAVLANKVGDPLKAGITVSYYYGFGPMPIGLSEYRDDKHVDGCFPGGLYYNMQRDTSGSSFIDILAFRGTESGYKWVKSPKVLTWNYKTKKVIPCGGTFPPVPAYKGLPPGTPALVPGQLALHDAAQYVDNVGCKDNSGLVFGRLPKVKIGSAGVVVSAKSTVSQCPQGASVPVSKDVSIASVMTPQACAQLVRSKKVEGICGDLYAVKLQPDVIPAGSSTPAYVPVVPTSGVPAPAPAPAFTTCSCCPPTPPASCVTCLAGSGNSGWETAPVFATKENWATMMLTDSMPKASTCKAAGAASWAAMASYRSSPLVAVGVPYVSNFEFMLKTAFWSLKAGWSATNVTGSENDYAELYAKGGDCMLAFRGSDSQVDMANVNSFVNTNLYHKMKLNYGVMVEWNHMVAKLTASKAFKVMKETCPKPLVVVGHSLGAALAQMFAVMANYIGDPLNMALTVDAIYAFGAVPIGEQSGGEPRNQKSADGCFKGGVYGNVNDNGDGTTVVDPAFTMGMDPPLGYRHARATKYIMWGTKQRVIPCGTAVTYMTDYKRDRRGLMPLHDFALYSNRVGC